MKHRVLGLILALMLLASGGMGFAATETIQSKDAAEEFDIIVVEGRSLISGSDLEDLGFDLNIENNNVLLQKDGISFHFQLGSRAADVNEISVKLDASPIQRNGDVYVPMAFLFEVLNYDVIWNSALQKIEVSKRPDTVYPVKFESFGFVYDCEKPAATISSTAPSITELLFAIGAGDRIQTRSTYCDYPSSALEIPAAGTLYDPSIEVIVSAAPEVLIAQTHFKPEVLVQLTKAGIDVVAVESPKTVDGVKELILDLGKITGQEAEARAVAISMEQRVQRVRSLVQNTQHPAVYYVVGTGQWGEYTAGNDTFIHDVLETAGLNNVAGDVAGWKYSLESLVQKNPAYILGGAYNLDTMNSSPNYAALQAVQSNQMIEIDENIFSRPALRIIDEGLPQLLELFHPEIDRSLIE